MEQDRLEAVLPGRSHWWVLFGYLCEYNARARKIGVQREDSARSTEFQSAVVYNFSSWNHSHRVQYSYRTVQVLDYSSWRRGLERSSAESSFAVRPADGPRHIPHIHAMGLAVELARPSRPVREGPSCPGARRSRARRSGSGPRWRRDKGDVGS